MFNRGAILFDRLPVDTSLSQFKMELRGFYAKMSVLQEKILIVLSIEIINFKFIISLT